MKQSHRTIKFTAEYSKKEVTFLDTKVKINNETNQIYTDLYTKDTDTHNYLHYTSAHPIHCKKGGPFGEFLRIRRNCHNIIDFEIHSNSRISDYQRRGYPLKDLLAAQERARTADREQLLKENTEKKKERERKNKNRIPLILTYNPANPHGFRTHLDPWVQYYIYREETGIWQSDKSN